jgi:hypothetical protein
MTEKLWLIMGKIGLRNVGNGGRDMKTFVQNNKE